MAEIANSSITTVRSVRSALTNDIIPIGSVLNLSDSRNVNANINSFQEYMACKSADEAIIGRLRGTTTCRKTPKGTAPSICAASSSSLGRPIM